MNRGGTTTRCRNEFRSTAGILRLRFKHRASKKNADHGLEAATHALIGSRSIFSHCAFNLGREGRRGKMFFVKGTHVQQEE